MVLLSKMKILLRHTLRVIWKTLPLFSSMCIGVWIGSKYFSNTPQIATTNLCYNSITIHDAKIQKLVGILKSAKKEIIIVSDFISSKEILYALRDATSTSVEIRIFLPFYSGGEREKLVQWIKYNTGARVTFVKNFQQHFVQQFVLVDNVHLCTLPDRIVETTLSVEPLPLFFTEISNGIEVIKKLSKIIEINNQS